MRARWNQTSIVLAGVLAVACSQPVVDDTIEEDRGPVEAVLDEVALTVWPGNVRADGSRYVRLLNGFFDGEASAYWFAGFASRNTVDVFWFCREGDSACPLDDLGVIDRTRTVGDPVFARVPGQHAYSPFWLIWTVRVPADYLADAIKSVSGIERAVEEGRARVERLIFDHGGDIGPEMTVMHCLLVPDGTVLEGNGDDAVDQPGVPTRFIPEEAGWHDRYRVKFFDFTPNEGVSWPDPASESRPRMRAADIFVLFRDCAGGSQHPLCDLGGGNLAAISERGVENDFTADGDKADNNNIISGFPRRVSSDPLDKLYSPLWKVNVVRVVAARDDELRLIDSTGDQNDTMVRDITTIRMLVDQGLLHPPEFISETDAGNPIEGNDGEVFFNCPSQVPL